MNKITAQNKIKLALFFGGKSAEHDVSILSAKNIFNIINKNLYDITLVKINKNNIFTIGDKTDTKIVTPHTDGKKFYLQTNTEDKKIDVVFPILHGPFGEDGSIQGLLKFYNVAFVGSDIIGSAIGMDKDVSKRLLIQAGIPVANFLVFERHEKTKIIFDKIKNKLGLPFFIKPANMGSSVGINKIQNQCEFLKAIKIAFSYDNKIIIEENINGRELECSILGNKKPVASAIGEIVTKRDFYSYEAKYIDKDGADLVIPADISDGILKKIQKTALKTYKVLCCEGMARVDFFLNQNNKIIVNEINTIPGFTSISMYPKLWEHSGISYIDLINKLILLAIERHKAGSKLKIN